MPRGLPGEQSNSAKLTADQVAEIRVSSESTAQLARRYSVSWGAIYHIRTGRTWVPCPQDDLAGYHVPCQVPGLPEGTLALRLFNGGYAIIDAADAERVRGHCWYFQVGAGTKSGEIACIVPTSEGPEQLLLHRLITEAPPDQVVIYRDGNPFDNRRANLALISYSTKVQRSRLTKRNQSGYKGVYLHRKRAENGHPYPWMATIQKDRRQLYLGAYATAQEAALRYNQVAIELFGEFAFQNDISEATDERLVSR
jgi:hypothetical protein